MPPGAILFFDDRRENVEAARRRGWNAQPIAKDGDPVPQIRRILRSDGVM